MQHSNLTVDTYHFDSSQQQHQLHIQQHQQQHFGTGNNNGDEYEKTPMETTINPNSNNNNHHNGSGNNNNNDNFFMDYGDMGSLTDEDLGGMLSDPSKFQLLNEALQFSPTSVLETGLEQQQTLQIGVGSMYGNGNVNGGIIKPNGADQQMNLLNIHDNNNSKLCQNNNLIELPLGQSTLQQQQQQLLFDSQQTPQQQQSGQVLSQDKEDVKPTIQSPTLPPIVISPADVDNISIQLEKNQQCACKDCGKLFNSVWYLKQHAVKHSNDRPFKCKFCMKTYKFRSNLYQHKCLERTRHEGENSNRRRLYTRNASEMRHHMPAGGGRPMLKSADSTDPGEYEMLHEVMLTMNPQVEPQAQTQPGHPRQHQRPARGQRQQAGQTVYFSSNYTGASISDGVFSNYSGTQQLQQQQQQDGIFYNQFGNNSDNNNNNNSTEGGFYNNTNGNNSITENGMTNFSSESAENAIQYPLATYYGASTTVSSISNGVSYPQGSAAAAEVNSSMRDTTLGMNLEELSCGECCFGGPQHDPMWSTDEVAGGGGCSLRATPLEQDYIDSYMQRNKNKVYPCRKCKLSFPSREYLDRHIAYHNALECEPFVCDRCPQRFANDKLLQNHLLQHSDRSPHKCPQCYGIFRCHFSSALALRRHKDQCRQCYCPPFGIHPRLLISPSGPLDPYGFVESEDEIVRSNAQFLQQQQQCQNDNFFSAGSSLPTGNAIVTTNSVLSSEYSTISNSMTIDPNEPEMEDDSHHYHPHSNHTAMMTTPTRLSTVHEKTKGIEDEDEDDEENENDTKNEDKNLTAKKNIRSISRYDNGADGTGLRHQISVGSGGSKYPDETDSGFRSRFDSITTTGAESYSPPASASSTSSSSSGSSRSSGSSAALGSGFGAGSNRRTRQSSRLLNTRDLSDKQKMRVRESAATITETFDIGYGTVGLAQFPNQMDNFPTIGDDLDFIGIEPELNSALLAVRRFASPVLTPLIHRKAKASITLFSTINPLNAYKSDLSPICQTTNFVVCLPSLIVFYVLLSTAIRPV